MYQKNEAKAWKCEALNNTYYINFVWLIVTLVIHRSWFRGRRQGRQPLNILSCNIVSQY